jgi:hypothetical protein
MKLLKTYKGCNIWDKEGAICVNEIADGEDYLFFVGLDDSKTHGNKKWLEDCNNVETAENYINWLTKVKTIDLNKVNLLNLIK